VVLAAAGEVPYYASLTPTRSGRWGPLDGRGRATPRRRARATPEPPTPLPRRQSRPPPRLRLGTYRDLWAGEVTGKPALRFWAPRSARGRGGGRGALSWAAAEVCSNGTHSGPGRECGPDRRAGILIEGRRENANHLSEPSQEAPRWRGRIPRRGRLRRAAWILVVKSIDLLEVHIILVLRRRAQVISRFSTVRPEPRRPVGTLSPRGHLKLPAGFRPAGVPFLFASDRRS
jgi:hypothetical protein